MTVKDVDALPLSDESDWLSERERERELFFQRQCPVVMNYSQPVTRHPFSWPYFAIKSKHIWYKNKYLLLKKKTCFIITH